MNDGSGIDAYMGGPTPELLPVASNLRGRIEALGPNLTPDLAWGFPCWSGNERVLSIIGHKRHVNLQLWYGAQLAPVFPERIEGTGKSLRHVKLADICALDAELDAIILAAIAQDFEAPHKVS